MNLIERDKQPSQDDDPVAFQIRRLRALPGYPADDTELLRVSRGAMPRESGLLILSQVIDRMLEEASTCPVPAEIRTALLARWPEQIPEWERAKVEQANLDAAAWKQFCAENDAIMRHAREKEKRDADMRQAIRQRLGYPTFGAIPYGMMLQAKHELGYELAPAEEEERRSWAEWNKLPPPPDPPHPVSQADMDAARAQTAKAAALRQGTVQ
jgi:hypothetical protein